MQKSTIGRGNLAAETEFSSEDSSKGDERRHIQEDTYKGGIVNRSDTIPQPSVEEVSQTGVRLEVRLIKLIQVATKDIGIKLEPRLSRPHGEL